ncbi:unnamed protein product [Clonostachys rosea f. rosea IK726]|uniref:Uncharacterized protein n=1 Tax=Clonostachys rosea f. rosea IK726 TaxID=1349383 RepID=A0ACA9UB52_BIOOC|nr:unnamed protein product [Clonostachys rosea f. rosea IK726]
MTFEDQKTHSPGVDPARALKINGGDLEEEEREREEEATHLPEIWTRQLQKSSSTAVVLLADEKSVQQVLKAIGKLQKTRNYPVWGENLADEVPSLGARWLSSHLQLNRVDKAETKRAVHAFFNTYNRKEKEAAELAKRLRNEPDEDGFVTVTRGADRLQLAAMRLRRPSRGCWEKQDKKKSDMKDFYRFQLRQRRRTSIRALLRRFDEDRKKVDAMREKRGKFKPET